MSSTLDTQRQGTSSGPVAEHEPADRDRGGTEHIGGQVAERVRSMAEQRTNEAGERATAVGEALRDTSEHLHSSGDDVSARALERVGDRIVRVGSYLGDSSPTEVWHDVEHAARRRPWTTAGAMVGIGFLAARVLGASSRRRYEARERGVPATTEYDGGQPSFGQRPEERLGVARPATPLGGGTGEPG
jgi:hypothetical protein